jgi:hypothetical protein
MTWSSRLVTVNLIPLHKPSVWSKFLSSMIGVPTLSLIKWFGSPDVCKEFKNSRVSCSNGSLSFASVRSIESALKYSFASPILDVNIDYYLTI